MERLLLLWDELDELVGFGRHFVAALSRSVSQRLRRNRRLQRSVAADQA